MGPLRDHLEKLRSFAVVARTGSFRRAAEKLRVSQPALSQSVQVLEGVVGKPLLVRSSRGVVPTEEGTLLRDFTERFLDEIENVERSLDTASGPMAGHFRLGTFESLTISLFPAFVAETMRKYSKLSLSIQSGDTSSLPEMVLDRSIHFAVYSEPRHNPRLSIEQLYKDSYCAYIATDVKPALRLPLVVVAPARDRDGKTVQEYVAAAEDRRPPTISLTTFEAVKNFTLQGVGIGVMPSLVTRADVAGGRLRPVTIPNGPDGPFGEHRIFVQTRTDTDARVRRLVQELRRYVESLMGNQA